MSIDEIRRMTRSELEEYILGALACMPIEQAARFATKVATEAKGGYNNEP